MNISHSSEIIDIQQNGNELRHVCLLMWSKREESGKNFIFIDFEACDISEMNMNKNICDIIYLHSDANS